MPPAGRGWLRVLLTAASVCGILAAFLIAVVPEGFTLRILWETIPLAAHLAALSAALLVLVGRAIRSGILAVTVGTRLGFSTAIRAQLAADAAGLVTPARLGGEAGKLLVLHRGGVAVGTGAAINLGEVLWEALAVAILVPAAFLVLPLPEALPVLGALFYVIGVLAVSLGCLLLAGGQRAEPGSILIRLGMSRKRWQGIRETAAEFAVRSHMLAGGGSGRRLRVLAVTLATIAARLAVLPFLLGATDVFRSAEIFVWPFVLLYGEALLPLPGGGGALELTFLAGLRDDLSPTLLAVAVFWWRTYTHLLPAAAGTLVLLGYRQRGGGRRPTYGSSSSPFPM